MQLLVATHRGKRQILNSMPEECAVVLYFHPAWKRKRHRCFVTMVLFSALPILFHAMTTQYAQNPIQKTQNLCKCNLRTQDSTNASYTLPRPLH